MEDEVKTLVAEALRTLDQEDSARALLNQEIARLDEECAKGKEETRIAKEALEAKRALKSMRDTERNAGIALDLAKNAYSEVSKNLDAALENIRGNHEHNLARSNFSSPTTVEAAKQLGLNVNRLLGSLGAILLLESNCNELRAKIDADKARHSGLLSDLSALATRIKEIPKAVAELKAEVKALNTQANQVDVLKVRYEQALKDLGASENFEALEKDKTSLAAKLLGANNEHLAILERYREESNAWKDNIAGVLAKSLEEGSPCQVCGSREHPAKAKLTSSFVSEVQVAETKSALDASHELIREIEKQLERLSGELDRAKKTA